MYVAALGTFRCVRSPHSERHRPTVPESPNTFREEPADQIATPGESQRPWEVYQSQRTKRLSEEARHIPDGREVKSLTMTTLQSGSHVTVASSEDVLSREGGILYTAAGTDELETATAVNPLPKKPSVLSQHADGFPRRKRTLISGTGVRVRQRLGTATGVATGVVGVLQFRVE